MKSSSQPCSHRLPCLAAIAGLLLASSAPALADGSIVINGRVQPQRSMSRSVQPAAFSSVSTRSDKSKASAVAELFESVMASEFGLDSQGVSYEIDTTAGTVTFAHPVDGERQVLTFAELASLSAGSR